MNGVVLGLGGSVLHVPPELRAAEPSDAAGAGDVSGVEPKRSDAVAEGATLESDGEETDEEEEMWRAVAEARRDRPPPPPEVIVISDSDSDSEQAPPNDPREGTGGDVADEAEAASALQRAPRRGREKIGRGRGRGRGRGGDGCCRGCRGSRRRVFHGGSRQPALELSRGAFPLWLRRTTTRGLFAPFGCGRGPVAALRRLFPGARGRGASIRCRGECRP